MPGMTVTAGLVAASSVGTVLAVDVLTGAIPPGGQPSHQFESEASTHQPGGTALFSAAGTASWLYAVAEYGPATSPGGVTTGTRVLGFSNASIGAGLYRNSTGGTTAGSTTNVSIGDTTPTCVAGEFVCAEILVIPGQSLILDPSTPAVPSPAATLTLATASFSPPPGALLVAYFGGYDGGGGTISSTISDSAGLTWTVVSSRATAGNGVATIAISMVPAAGSCPMPVNRMVRTPTRYRWVPNVVDNPGQASAPVPVSLADAAAGTDSLDVSVTVPLADTGAAAETVAEAVTAPLADVAAGTEALSVSATIPLADVAAAAEASSVSATVSLADTGAAADVPSISATVPLADAAAGVQLIAETATLALADTGAGIEALAVSVALSLADTGAAADLPAVTATLALADAGASSDTTAVSAQIAVADLGAAGDALLVGSPVSLLDAAGAADSLAVTVVLQLADAGAVTNALAVFTGSGGSTGTADWEAAPGPPRWKAEPAAARWAARPAAARWILRPAPAQWTASPAPGRWRIIMTAFDPIAAISLEEVNVTWTSDLAGTTIDPTTGPLPVQMAFPLTSGNPARPAAPVSWVPASWLAGTSAKGFIAQCLAGPGGAITLTAGQAYDVWSKITGSPETPAKFAGTIKVY